MASPAPILDQGNWDVHSVMHPSVRQYLPALIKYSMGMEQEKNMTTEYCKKFIDSFKKEFKIDIKGDKKDKEKKKQIILGNKEETVNGIRSWFTTYQKFISYVTDHDLSNLILKYRDNIDDDYKKKYILIFQSCLLAYIKISKRFEMPISDKYDNLDLDNIQVR